MAPVAGETLERGCPRSAHKGRMSRPVRRVRLQLAGYEAFQQHGHALPATDAHRLQPDLLVVPPQGVDKGGRDARPVILNGVPRPRSLRR